MGKQNSGFLVYHKDFEKSGMNPCFSTAMVLWQHIDPWFSSARLSLLDRGFTFAIAHIRGGRI